MPKIKVSKNGPYLVSGSLPINEEKIECDSLGVPRKTVTGKKYPQSESCALCRCGHSQDKPFCDKTHLKINFEGTETADINEKYENEAEVINGPDLDLKDVPHLCAGLGFCHRGSDTWTSTENSDDPESKKMAVESACACAAGRLTAVDKKSGKNIEPKLEPSIGALENGPLLVKGGIPVESAEGKTYEVRNRCTLCRCGESVNKPFCDGSHQY